MITRCLARMSVWKDLAISTLRTEFPSFELCQAFSVLRLGAQMDFEVNPATYSCHLKRLAKYVDQEPAALRRQLEAFRPGAVSAYNVASITTLQAWHNSIYRNQPAGHQPSCQEALCVMPACSATISVRATVITLFICGCLGNKVCRHQCHAERC